MMSIASVKASAASAYLLALKWALPARSMSSILEWRSLVSCDLALEWRGVFSLAVAEAFGALGVDVALLPPVSPFSLATGLPTAGPVSGPS